ncbi:DUF4041 domain-containing protein [Facklamia hominis]|uniref:DUF4041 domain-containing protein n=1 Tax=Facklamia hominis TaxID=178214 RepID=UPI0021530EAA|nr:DUF4041 domain-containing protein [Facklamia hominis]
MKRYWKLVLGILFISSSAALITDKDNSGAVLFGLVIGIVLVIWHERSMRSEDLILDNKKESFWKKNKESIQESTNIESNDVYEEYGLYEPRYNFATSLAYKERLKDERSTQKDMIKNYTAVNYSKGWRVDGSLRKGKKMTKGNIKVILRCFNSESEAAINKLTYRNFETTKNRIFNSYTQLNKAFETNKVSISKKYLNSKINELHLAYEYEMKIQEEKEILREERERKREEAALQKEIEQKRKQIQKEIEHNKNMLHQLRTRLQESNDSDNSSLLKEISRLENNISDYENEEKDLDYRIENAGAGYVYIISNIGSFGEDVVKIGVTRRLEPMDRISELSSASVPFKFDVHALIFSYQAFDLETKLHHRFSKQRINLVNNRKEFFKVPIGEIEKALNEFKDLTIEFHTEPEAEEYRQSMAIRNKQEINM